MNGDKESTSNVEEEQPRDLTGKKEYRPKYVSVNVKLADAHYLASFDHGPNRVFHNVAELLLAIEVEVNRLSGG